MDCSKKLGIIAGCGTLPQAAAKNAASRGFNVVTIAFFRDVFEKMKPYSSKIYHINIGQVKKVFKTLKHEAIKDLIMIGKFEKRMLFENLKFDLKALSILSKMHNRNDDTIMLAIADEFEKSGINVLEQANFLKDMFPKQGVLTSRTPSSREYRDIEYGFDLAKRVAGLDIGQTVIVKGQSILAVEAIEGTDKAIKRGCMLGGKGVTVVKVSKPSQDPRFDVPAIGRNTIDTMSEGMASILAVEAGKTILVNKDEMTALADSAGIAIVAV